MNNNDNTTSTIAANVELNNNHGLIEIAELTTPIGVTLKGLKIDIGAAYSDDVNRNQCSLVKSLICDYIAPIINRGLDHLEKDADARERRREREAEDEHNESVARAAKYEAEAKLAMEQLNQLSGKFNKKDKDENKN